MAPRVVPWSCTLRNFRPRSSSSDGTPGKSAQLLDPIARLVQLATGLGIAKAKQIAAVGAVVEGFAGNRCDSGLCKHVHGLLLARCARQAGGVGEDIVGALGRTWDETHPFK